MTATVLKESISREKALVLERGCFSPEENLEIFNRGYNHPRHQLFLRVAEELDLRNKVVADAGCGYGASLHYCHPDSYGIDKNERAIKFCKALGLNAYVNDIVEDDLSYLPKADVVWNSATIEHVDSPHIFLRKLHGLLKPNGIMVLEVPYTGSYFYSAFKFLPNPRKQSGDHINAFTPTTLQFFCERAGFETLSVRRWSSKLQKHLPDLPLWTHRVVPLAPIADRILYMGRKPEQWQYPKTSTRRA